MVYLFLYIVNEPLFFFDVDFNKKKCVKKVINEKHWKKPLSAMKALHQNYRKHTNRSRCIPEANPETFATCIIDTHAHVPRHKITLIRWQGSAFNCRDRQMVIPLMTMISSKNAEHVLVCFQQTADHS